MTEFSVLIRACSIAQILVHSILSIFLTTDIDNKLGEATQYSQMGGVNFRASFLPLSLRRAVLNINRTHRLHDEDMHGYCASYSAHIASQITIFP